MASCKEGGGPLCMETVCSVMAQDIHIIASSKSSARV